MATPANKANTGATSAQLPKKPATGARQGNKTAQVRRGAIPRTHVGTPSGKGGERHVR